MKKSEMTVDGRGYFRWFGRRLCRFGRDKTQATLAHAKVSSLWQRTLEDCGTWDATTWLIANALRKGQKEIRIPPHPDMVGNGSYVHWVDRLARAYGKPAVYPCAEPDSEDAPLWKIF